MDGGMGVGKFTRVVKDQFHFGAPKFGLQSLTEAVISPE